MHHRGIVLARKNVARAAHIGRELIHFLDSFHRLPGKIRIAQITTLAQGDNASAAEREDTITNSPSTPASPSR